MDESGLRRWRAVLVLGVSGAVPGLATAAATVVAGCHDGAAGGRPSDGGQDVTPETSEKLGREAGCSDDGPGGGGCPLNLCGEVKSIAALGFGEVASTGADALCTPPDACVPAEATAGGTALQLRCVTPLDGAAAFGAACARGAAAPAAMRCGHDALCVDAPGTTGSPFCTALCRADTDCPASAYCLEYRSEALPNGSFANLGMCTPAAKLPAGATACAREADCAAGEGCLSYGARTTLHTCRPAVPSGTKSLGQSCASAGECRSGECYDRDGNPPSGSRRAFCAGVCTKNSDCGADQRCVRLVTGNNGTAADPTDDVLAGYCRTLVVPLPAEACGVAADCAARNDGSDTCDVRTGACYKAGAPAGAACAGDAACDLGATCTTGNVFTGGYCRVSGCAPGAAAGSADACPGTKAVCSQRASDAPVRDCYEGCEHSFDCARAAAGYACTAPRAGSTDPLVCLAGGGT